MLSCLFALCVFADARIPTADKPGSADNPLLKRYEGSWIVGQELQSYGEFTFPLSPLEAVPGERDSLNNNVFTPPKKLPLEGRYTRLVYVLPENRSPLEVFRNYQQEIQALGGRTLFECNQAECGGDPGKSSAGGGGNMSLSMYLYPASRIQEDLRSAGGCAMTSRIGDQRFVVAQIPAKNTHLSVLTYTMQPRFDIKCEALKGRTIAVVDIVEGEAREQKMVEVDATEMAREITAAGRVSLYGIYFDSNEARVKPESEPTLAEIAKLLASDPSLDLLVVGHTDSVGGLDANRALSQRRAEAVAAALVGGHEVDGSRLTPIGVAYASPVAGNQTPEGRAQNRRVELVRR